MRLPRSSRLFCILVSFSLIPPLILILGLLKYLDRSMRICVPFSLHRVSKQAHNVLSCQPASVGGILRGNFTTSATVKGHHGEMSASNGGGSANGGRLADFLRSQKEAFLGDLEEGKGSGWVVAMGNEAGDLDSLAASIAFAQLSSSLSAMRTVPLILTPKAHMDLRPENNLALELSSVPLDSLLHLEALPVPSTDLASRGVKFALVDHNRLLPPFGAGQVEAIIDHHDDEHAHLDASIREIQVPTGSSTSLVTKHFSQAWKAALSRPGGKTASPIPTELATLLLTGILIDTTGLKPDRKATPTDYEAASFLFPLSTLATPDTEAELTSFSSEGSRVPRVLTDLTTKLQDTKSDVSALSTYQLLMRDYKEYSLPTRSEAYPTLKVGLSTVPMGLKKWLDKESDGWNTLLTEVDGYMSEKTLDMEGILTSYKSDKKGQSRRELALTIRSGGVVKSHEDAQAILNELGDGLEASGEVLGLAKWNKTDLPKGAFSNAADGRWTRVWKQENVKATRKQVAPLLRDLTAKLH
ncbi:hypothetical protein IAU60_005037 [Kwoniella sp. DSM 27419]